MLKFIFTTVLTTSISLILVFFGAWLAYRYQKWLTVRSDRKELRNRFILLKSHFEAYEYLILAQIQDLHFVCYRYAFNFTRSRLSTVFLQDSTSHELANQLETTREKHELTMFEFRKLISEFKSLTGEDKLISEITKTLFHEDYDKWNIKFNRMKTIEELKEYEISNKEDSFGQGGERIEPTKTIAEKQTYFSNQMCNLYEMADKYILELQSKI